MQGSLFARTLHSLLQRLDLRGGKAEMLEVKFRGKKKKYIYIYIDVDSWFNFISPIPAFLRVRAGNSMGPIFPGKSCKYAGRGSAGAGLYQVRVRTLPSPCISDQILQVRIIEWFGFKGTLKIISFQPPAMSRDIFHQPRLLRAPSSLALNPAREEAATASLGSLFQCFTTLTMKNFFLISNLNLPSFSLEPFPLVLSLHSLVTSPSPAFP